MRFIKVHTLKNGYPCYINPEYIFSIAPAYDDTGKVSGSYISSVGSTDEILCKEWLATVLEQIEEPYKRKGIKSELF